MAERLHHEVSLETQAGKVFQFVTGHRPGSVLGAHGGHLGLAVHARANAVHATGFADHLLRQGKAFAGVVGLLGKTEYVRWRKAQGFTCLAGQAAADNQRNTTAGPHLIKDKLGFQLKSSEHFVAAMLADFARVRIDVDHVAHRQLLDIHFDRQGAGVFHGVKKMGAILPPKQKPPARLLGT